MAKFKTTCPLCQSEIHVYSQWAGQQASCPSCNGTITIPEAANISADDMPHITACPSCKATQSIPADAPDRVKRSCQKCGAPFLYMTDISFKCAEKLPPDQSGNARIACPYCGKHYVLKYSPANGLVGCQECMNIFAAPDTGDSKHIPQQLPRLLPPTIQKAAPAPIRFQQPPVQQKTFADDDIKFQPAEPKTPPPMTITLTPATLQEPQQLKPVPITPIQGTDDDNEMIQIRPRIYKEPPTIVLNDTIPPKPVQKAFVFPAGEEKTAISRDTLPQQDAGDPNSPQKDPSALAAKLTGIFGKQAGIVIFTILRLFMNILWLLLGGLLDAFILAIFGVILCLTIIGIPFGLQVFKLAALYLCPFGADVYRKKTDSDKVGCWITGLNILWIVIFGGAFLALGNFLAALLLFITIIGTPWALQFLKLGKLVLTPFGLEIRLAPGMKTIYIIAAVLAVGILLLL